MWNIYSEKYGYENLGEKNCQSSKSQNVWATDGAAGSELASALLGTLRYPCQFQACEK
jgi:hypothetical protein